MWKNMQSVTSFVPTDNRSYHSMLESVEAQLGSAIGSSCNDCLRRGALARGMRPVRPRGATARHRLSAPLPGDGRRRLRKRDIENRRGAQTSHGLGRRRWDRFRQWPNR